MICDMYQSEQPENIYAAPDDRDKVFVFRSYNFTIAVYWSPYLVHVEDKQITLPNNQTAVVPDVHLDKLDEAFVSRMPGVDFLQISTGSPTSFQHSSLLSPKHKVQICSSLSSSVHPKLFH